MKRIFFIINLVVFVFFTTINSIFLFEISKDQELSNFYFKNIELSENYSSLETEHMHEVKDLVNASLLINLFSLFVFLLFDRSFQKNFYIAGISLFSISLLFFIAALSFEEFFNQWHELVFVSDSWLLPADAKLIKDYPLVYFRNKFILFDSLLAFFGIFMLILSKKYKFDLK